MEDFIKLFTQQPFSFLFLGCLPTFPPLIVEAQSGYVEILPLSWLLPPTLKPAARKGSALKASLQIWRTDSPRKLFEHSLPFSSATQQNFSVSAWMKAPHFLTSLSKKKIKNEKTAQETFEVRCLISSYSDKEVMRDLVLDTWTTNPQTFDLSFPEGCRWKFQIKSICDTHWYSTLCNTFCKDQEPYYKCSKTGEKNCNPGWKGTNCSIDIDECANDHVSPCRNNSTCVNHPGSYSCFCTPGYNGRDCDVDVDECKDLSQCANGGTCVNFKGTFECHCRPGYVGLNCQVALTRRKRSGECDADFCFHGGFCQPPNDESSEPWCSCADGFSGRRCETDDKRCGSVLPCYNGGICANISDSYACKCSEAYKGDHCETAKSCDEINCHNEGTCVDSDEGFNCTCPEPFTGDFCEIDATDSNNTLWEWPIVKNATFTPTSGSKLFPNIKSNWFKMKRWPGFVSLIFTVLLTMIVIGALITIPTYWLASRKERKPEKIKMFTIKLKPETSSSDEKQPGK